MNKRLENIQVFSWAIWEGLLYSVHLPSKFKMIGSIEEVRKGFHWSILCRFRGPCADRWGSHDFFSTSAYCKHVLESQYGFVIHVVDNPGNGSWKDAVFEVKPTNPDEWEVNLLFFAGGSTERRNSHNKFLLIELKEKELEIVQFFLSKDWGASDTRKKIEIFKEIPQNPSNQI